MDIRKLREKFNLSREDLASKLRVSTQTIYRWEETDTTPHPIFQEKMNRIFSALENRNESN